MPKRALITGITGQDGSYLAEFLLEKGYEVFGLIRRCSTEPLLRIEPLVLNKQIKLIVGNLRDSATLREALRQARPDEIYNLAAQSDVGISFDCEDETWETNYHGVGRLVHAAMEFNPKVRIYQASTSEMFGATPPPQDENSLFTPVSPYAKAKTKTHEDFVVGYRERHGLFICSGILFNHESPRRGKHFVTRKITHSLAKIKQGRQSHLELGNLQAKRDWGFAGDYVKAMWMMLQRDEPEDFVIATGISHTVEEFVKLAAHFLEMEIEWLGSGETQVGIILETKSQLTAQSKVVVRVNPIFFRQKEVAHLLGDAHKAHFKLGWKPEIDFRNLVAMMVNADFELISRSQPSL